MKLNNNEPLSYEQFGDAFYEKLDPNDPNTNDKINEFNTVWYGWINLIRYQAK